MKRIMMVVWLLSFSYAAAQDVPLPAAKKQLRPVLIKNATIHTGTGEVIEGGHVRFENGKITSVGSGDGSATGADVIDAKDKHVYPGLIALNTPLGLVEIDAVRPTRDFNETGDINPNVRAIVGYNTDSRVTPTVRSNGILMAQITPQASVFSGLSSIVELDAWNYEDAIYRKDDALYMEWPRMTLSKAWWAPPVEEQKSRMEKRLGELYKAFDDAYSYYKALTSGQNIDADMRWDAMVPVFKKERPLFIRAEHIKQIRAAVALTMKYDLKVVLVGADDAYLALDLLKENNVPVILEHTHGLPARDEEPADLYFRLPKIVKDAGILYALNVGFGSNGAWDERNLPFLAGNTAGYGLTKEEALMSVTSNAAKILGIDQTVGSLAVGKDATLIISAGDILDMRTSAVETAFIRGRKIDLGNKQIDLYKKFKTKYERAD